MRVVRHFRNSRDNCETGLTVSETFSELAKSGGRMERHLQTGIQVLLVALVFWTVAEVQKTSVLVAELRQQVISLQGQVNDWRRVATTAYTRESARAELTIIRERLDELGKRIRELEMRRNGTFEP